MQNFLLVDDNETLASLLIRGFERQDCHLTWAKNTEEALGHTGLVDGIILDLNLGEESGLQLLPDLAKKFPHSKIIVLTGYASISTAVSAVKLGAVQYLPKPANVDTILQAFHADEETIADVAATPVPEEMPSIQRLQWEHIQFALQQNDGNISATARALNMHRRTLQRILSKHPVKK